MGSATGVLGRAVLTGCLEGAGSAWVCDSQGGFIPGTRPCTFWGMQGGGFKPTLGQLLSMGEGSPPPPPLLLLLAPCAVSKHRLVGHQPRAAGEAGGVSVMSRCRANGTKRVS